LAEPNFEDLTLKLCPLCDCGSKLIFSHAKDLTGTGKDALMNPMPPAAELSTFCLGGDFTINRLRFGAMQLPSQAFHGPARDPETGRQVLRRAIEFGVNHIDTQTSAEATTVRSRNCGHNDAEGLRRTRGQHARGKRTAASSTGSSPQAKMDGRRKFASIPPIPRVSATSSNRLSTSID
jgi:hypothetical protein